MSEADNLQKITNRPGLSVLSYRVGDYASFRQDLLAQLSQNLPGLKTRDQDDAAIALLDAWAIVADVLTFYQERIANEGYLNTATERQSIIELARLIGYELKPGVSASTYLAFTIEDKPGDFPLVTIPHGTQVMSIPGEGQLPQLFETSKDLVAAPNWNALQPRLSKTQEIIYSTHQLYLVGTKTQLAAGDWVLLTGKEDEDNKEFALLLKTVQLFPDLDSTLITWDDDLDIDRKNQLRNAKLFAFRQQARLFGSNAPRWQDTPDDLKRKSPGVKLQGGVFVTSNPEEKATATTTEEAAAKKITWVANSLGLPNQDILCLAVGEKLLFAGTDGSGVFRGDKINQAWNWQMINSGLTNLNIQTLLVIDKTKGHLLAGTANGGVFRTKDNGENWSSIGLGNIRLEKSGSDPKSVNTGIPNVVVRSLLTYDIGETSFIFAGTDDDIYRTTNQGQDWSSSKIPSNLNPKHQNYEHLTGLPNRVIYALLCIPEAPKIVIGQIRMVNPWQKQIVIGKVTITPRQWDIITVEQETRQITEILTVTITLNQPFSPSIVVPKPFTSSNQSTGTITKVNGKKIRVNIITGFLEVGDSLTVDGQTIKITKINLCQLQLDQVFSPDVKRKNLTNMRIFAGTDKGIYYSDNYGGEWKPNPTQISPSLNMSDKEIYCLSCYTFNNKYYILAGTNKGVWRSVVGTSLTWESISDTSDDQLSDQSVRSLGVLTVTNQNYVFAGTDEGVWRAKVKENASDWKWYKTGENAIVKKITSIAILAQETQVLAGAKFSGFTQEQTVNETSKSTEEPKELTEWPNFYLQNNQIDLDTLYPKILAESWVLLVDKSQNLQNKIPANFPSQVKQVFSEQRQGFTLDTKITRILSDRNIDNEKAKNSQNFNPRSTLVLAQSEDLPLAKISLTVPVQQTHIFQDPLWDNNIFLGQYVHGLAVKQNVIVSGKHIRAKANVGGIFRSRNWQLSQSNLDTENIKSLAFREADGKLFALTEQGIWRSEDRGKTWQIITTEKPDNANITCIAVYSKPINSSFNSYQDILSAKQTGSASSPFADLEFGDTITIAKKVQIGETSVLSKQTRIIKTTATQDTPFRVKIDKNLTIDVHYDTEENWANKLFVSTDKGVYRFQEDNQGEPWKKISDKISNDATKKVENVQALSVNPHDHSIVAGTQDQGVFISNDGGQNWSQTWDEKTIKNIITLAADKNTGYVFAGTEKNGVFCYKGGKWESINKNLPELHIVSLAIDSQKNVLFAGTGVSGVFQLSLANTNDDWKAVNKNLPDLQILNLFVGSDYLFASTEERGVFCKSPDREVWESVNVGLSDRQVQCFTTINSENRLLAGTSEGLFEFLQTTNSSSEIYWEHSNQGLIYNNVQTLVSHRFDGILYLFAGTKSGVFRSLDQGQTWELMIKGLTNKDIQTLLVVQDKDQDQDKAKIFSGTKEGLFYSKDLAKNWQAIKLTQVPPNVQALAIYQDKEQSLIFVGTLDAGVFRSSDNGESWQGIGLTKQDIRVIFSRKDKDGDLLVGTAGNGIFYSNNNGNTWEHWTDTRPSSGTISSNGVTVSGTKIETKVGTTEVNTKFLTELKSGDQIESDSQIRTVVSIKDNGELTVDTPFKPMLTEKPFAVYTGLENLYITTLAVFDNKIFAGTAGSGVLGTDDNGKHWKSINTTIVDQQQLPDLEIRCFTVDKKKEYLWMGTATRGVFRLKKESDSWESVSAGLMNTDVTNTDVRTILIEESNLYLGGIGILPSLDGINFVELQTDDLLRVVTAPKIINNVTEWQVLDRNNFQGKLITTTETDINLQPAAEEDPLVSEMAVIQYPPDNEDLPLLTLKENLQYSYDPATVKVYANVVEATQGETISEILGSGNGTLTNQTFILSKPPLTHIAASTSSGGKSTIKVYVNDVEWTEVPSLYDLDKQAPSYILRIEDDGTTSITFGDGYRGTRLPSGRENITATYRSGLGLGGNVEPERITLKKTGPPSIQGVTNPLPATGGAESQSLESSRSTVPATTRTLDRIVSRQDFEDFTQAFAGIGKAQAVPLWNGTTELLHITIAGIGGQPILPESALYKSLVNAINLARDSVQQVQISPFKALFFDIEAKVKLETGDQVAIVEADIRKKLRETFAFEKRAFGQPVTQSEVIAVIQSVKGVQAMDLDFLYRLDASRTLQQSLSAATAFWDFAKNRVQPAQLLMLHPSHNITLTFVANL